MSEPFDFEAFIAGTVIPRFEVPLYGVVHQSRINDLDARIKEQSQTPAGDERESSTSPLVELTAERDRLVAEQEASARMVELRPLSAEEFHRISKDSTLDAFDQIAAQSRGTRNEGDRDLWFRVQESAAPGAWALFVQRANEIALGALVMPDFSLSASTTQSQPESSRS